MHTTRIILESFKVEGALAFNNCSVEIWLGDIEADGTLHNKAALMAYVYPKDASSEYRQLFKGYNMLSQASEWLNKRVESYWTVASWNTWLSKLYEDACL